MYTKEHLKRQLRQIGLSPADTVLIHTSLRSVGQVEGGADGFIDAFSEYLSRGLFLVPTHTWANVNRENPVYDVRRTVPCIGLVPRTAAFRPDGVRSLHPTHSIWAKGADAAAFVAGEELSETPAPVGGAWWKLGERKAKILLIGVTQNRNTFIHAVDEIARLDDRLSAESFPVTVIDGAGNRTTHAFRPHGHTGSENFDNFEPMLVASGAVSFARLGDAVVRVVDAAKCRDALLRFYQGTRENLCFVRQDIPQEYWKNANF